jgi:hypothetical protein
MRRAGVRILSAVLASGLALTACAAQEVDSDYHSMPPPKPSWFSGWFSWGKGSTAPAPAPAPEAKKLNIDTTAPKPPMPDPSQLVRDREEKAMWRRLLVCDRLKAIAIEHEDAALQRRVEELEERLNEVYRQRMERVGNDDMGGAPSSSGHGGTLGSAANTRGGNR